jgi:hypothetical protein
MGEEKPKGVPEEERFHVSVCVMPPLNYVPQAALFPVYPNLGRVGGIRTSAGDPGLRAALKKLVDDALRPVDDLDGAAKHPPLDGVLKDGAPDGLSAKLVADKGRWKAGEAPTFKVETGNAGKEEWEVGYSDVYVQVDGQWYQKRDHLPNAGAATPLLSPGGRQSTSLSISGTWVERIGRGRAEEEDLILPPGKHTVSVRYWAGTSGTNKQHHVRISSNTVEIEVLPAGAKE